MDTLQSKLEALLIVSQEAVSARTLSTFLDVSADTVQDALVRLQHEYTSENRGFQLCEVVGGWRLYTHPAYQDLIQAYIQTWDYKRLSQAALETLAVIAYHQPVSREGIRAIRGVASDGPLASLKEKGYIREAGHDKQNPHTVLFATTKAFLEAFDLRSLSDLPPLEQFAANDASKEFIRQRLQATSQQTDLLSEDIAQEVEAQNSQIGNE